MTAGAVLALTAVAVWLWTGPDRGTTRLHRMNRRGPAMSHSLRERFARRSRPAGRAAAWRTASIELCQGLSAELSAGRTAGESLARAVQAASFPDPVVLRPLVAAARDGGDVPAALLAVAPEEGGEAFHALAACWKVSVTTGAGLSVLVERVTASLREAQAHRRNVTAQLAGPRATARLLAGLPVLGITMAAGLGMRPLHFLFGGPAGAGCLILGLALDACGLWWTHRLVVRAQRA
ncbi:tight adherence protein B [Streptosporangium becharense]|uniref:Tight adherence protein B n=1 Tax=Streptosporangium becharense TaxID=1816182 RepID=A0A7W9MGE8_9ACTN|nr:type II secretion system F family protein [Streptosporangium becharense]MBB2908965.1 tight adherence protein B [Streptosporangium becharense]MBB5820017.1 tight adherence protein B [Streptosporangium becharense]